MYLDELGVFDKDYNDYSGIGNLILLETKDKENCKGFSQKWKALFKRTENELCQCQNEAKYLHVLYF